MSQQRNLSIASLFVMPELFANLDQIVSLRQLPSSKVLSSQISDLHNMFQLVKFVPEIPAETFFFSIILQSAQVSWDILFLKADKMHLLMQDDVFFCQLDKIRLHSSNVKGIQMGTPMPLVKESEAPANIPIFYSDKNQYITQFNQNSSYQDFYQDSMHQDFLNI